MSIEQSLERIADALEILTKDNIGTQTVAEPIKPGRPKKETVAPASAPEVDPLAEEPKAISYDEVHAQLRAFKDKFGIEPVKKLMIEHGAAAAKPTVQSIPAENYTALMAKIKELMK